MTNFTLKNPKYGRQSAILIFFLSKQFKNSGRAITEGCFRVRFRTTFSSYNIILKYFPSRHKTLNQSFFNVGPPSMTLNQRLTNIDSRSCVC